MASGSGDSYPEPRPEVDPYYGGSMKESSGAGSMIMDDSLGSGDSIPMATSYDYGMEESDDSNIVFPGGDSGPGSGPSSTGGGSPMTGGVTGGDCYFTNQPCYFLDVWRSLIW
jgi:hypothetical protein